MDLAHISQGALCDKVVTKDFLPRSCAARWMAELFIDSFMREWDWAEQGEGVTKLP